MREKWTGTIIRICTTLIMTIVFVLIPRTDACAVKPLHLITSRSNYNLGEFIEYLEDPTKTLEIEDVNMPHVSITFTPSTTKTLNMGLTESAYWFRFTLAKAPESLINPAFVRDWLLSIDWPFLSNVRLYYPAPADTADNETGRWIMQEIDKRSIGNGDNSQAGGELPPPPRLMLFRLPERIENPTTMFLRVESDTALFLPARISADIHYFDMANKVKLGYGFFYGILLTIAIVNLIHFFSMRDRSYLWHFLFVVSTAFFFLCVNGLVREYVIPFHQTVIPPLTLLFLCLVFMFANQFARSFLMTKSAAPRWDVVLRIFMTLPLLILIAAPFAGSRIVLKWTIVYIYCVLFVLLGAGFSVWRKGFRPARYYLESWSALCVGVLIYALLFSGVIPYTFLSAHSFQISTAFEVILLQFALFDRMDSIRGEREEARRNERRYMMLSITDSLTGLYNVRYFQSQVSLEIRRAVDMELPLSLIMLDVDNFKDFNDTFGHPEGDKVLAKLGQTILTCVRENDIACRYGGEEFVVILPGSAGSMGRDVAERIRVMFGLHTFVQKSGVTKKVTVSAGVAEYVAGYTPVDLVERADKALYQAKSQGKNLTVMEG